MLWIEHSLFPLISGLTCTVYILWRNRRIGSRVITRVLSLIYHLHPCKCHRWPSAPDVTSDHRAQTWFFIAWRYAVSDRLRMGGIDTPHLWCMDKPCYAGFSFFSMALYRVALVFESETLMAVVELFSRTMYIKYVHGRTNTLRCCSIAAQGKYVTSLSKGHNQI